MTEALLLSLVGVLVLINGFFVSAEFALVRSRPSRLEARAEDGSTAAQRALKLVENVDEYVAACQVGITLASIGIGFLGEPAIASLLEDPLGDVFSHGVAVVISFAIAFGAITLAHVIAGEQAPKMIAIAQAERIMIAVARPLAAFRLLAKPLITATNAPAQWFVRRMLRIEAPEDSEAAGPEELQLLITRSGAHGSLDPGEAVMLKGVFHLHEQEAREVMTAIPAVVTVDADENVADALQRCVSTGHTRLVVVEDGNPDRVRGIVHNNSLIRLYLNAGGDSPIEPAIRDANVFPETKPLDDLLAELQALRVSMGVVVDEYGRTVGIVTVEDIIEEIVGEIEDETDARAVSIRELSDGDFYVRGHVSLGDLADQGIELPVDTDAFNSIGGYVFSELGRGPRRGDRVEADGYTIRVESVRDNRIIAVRIARSASTHTPTE